MEDKDKPDRINIPEKLKVIYTDLTLLGKGGFGEVYKTYNSRTNTTMAIKVLRKYLESDLVSNEIKVMKALKGSPYIVEYYSHKHYPEYNLIIIEMEYMSGYSLRHLISDRSKIISDSTAARIVYQICSALIEMNLKNISHNDLKPENILLDDTDDPQVAKLGDFGLAQTMGMQMDIGVRGTKIYQAPEQRESKKYSIESSVWALGIILYELIVRKHPYCNNEMDYSEFCEKTSNNTLVKPAEFSSHAWLLYKVMMVYEFNKRVNLYEICTYPWITRNFDYNVYLNKDRNLKQSDSLIKAFNQSIFFTTFMLHDSGNVDYTNVTTKSTKTKKDEKKLKKMPTTVSRHTTYNLTKKRSISMSRTSLRDISKR